VDYLKTIAFPPPTTQRRRTGVRPASRRAGRNMGTIGTRTPAEREREREKNNGKRWKRAQSHHTPTDFQKTVEICGTMMFFFGGLYLIVVAFGV